MLTLTSRLGTLDPKAKYANRTAKDGEEYTQLVFEVGIVEVSDPEVNALFASPQAYAAIVALHRSVKGIKAIELDEKLEGATVTIQLGAVSAANGPVFTFAGCRVDKIKLSTIGEDALNVSFRVTSKPALDAKFGELVGRLGHTIMVEVSAQTPSDQADLPLNSVGAHEAGTSSIGTPEQERDRARSRQRKIDAEMDAVH